MGIDIRVQDERGGIIRELLDPKSLVPMLLPEQDGHGSACLRFIDRYGDTYFNQIQIPVLLDELKSAARSCRNAEAKAHGEAVVALVASTVDQVHTYVRFIGD
jgi:hypothetical protein